MDIGSRMRMDAFDVLHGELRSHGSFGEVLAARHRATNRHVALKRICIRKPEEGLPENVIRELLILENISHKNVVSLLFKPFADATSLVLPLELCQTDLYRVLYFTDSNSAHTFDSKYTKSGDSQSQNDGRGLREELVAAIAKQLFAGVDALHRFGIMHRDLKPSNILFTADGTLKLADLGMARTVSDTSTDENEKFDLGNSETMCHTPCMGSRWYRSPELLYGSRKYDETIDLWSLGCIIAECLTGQPLLPGETDIDQLRKIHFLIGTPEEGGDHGLENSPDFSKIRFKPCRGCGIDSVVLGYSSLLSSRVLKSLIQYNGKKRGRANDYLAHAWLLAFSDKQ